VAGLDNQRVGRGPWFSESNNEMNTSIQHCLGSKHELTSVLFTFVAILCLISLTNIY